MATALNLCGQFKLSECSASELCAEDLALLMQDIGSSHNTFGSNVLKEFVSSAPGENILFSPISAALSLSILQNGARTRTLRQIIEATQTLWRLDDLNLVNAKLIAELTENKGDEKLFIANSLWSDIERFEYAPRFLDSVRTAYSAQLELRNFADPTTLMAINRWVDDNTNQIIPFILAELNPATVAILLNALSFEGKWRAPFLQYGTKEEDFTLQSGEKTKAKMMRKIDTVSYAELKGAQFISLSFAADDFTAGRFVLDIALPATRVTLQDFINDQVEISRLRTSAKPEVVNLLVPKFKFDFQKSLKPILIKWGMEDTFSDRADLSDLGRSIHYGGNLFIQDVLQKTAIEMDENGFKAAAATTVLTGLKSIRMPTKTFVANRPFVISLRDTKTDVVIFLGVVSNPEWK
ncbi:MAG: serine protease inhibitor [Bacteriovoracaceae bacterium]|nr:serine protease inhibitor [Bacteriovoracaceae bacterium]